MYLPIHLNLIKVKAHDCRICQNSEKNKTASVDILETAPPQNNNNNNNNGEPTIVAGTKHEFNTVLILSCCDEQLHLCGGWMGVVDFWWNLSCCSKRRNSSSNHHQRKTRTIQQLAIAIYVSCTFPNSLLVEDGITFISFHWSNHNMPWPRWDHVSQIHW